MIKLNSKSDTFVVIISEPLSDYKRKVFDDLYLPLVGSMASSLYNAFYSCLSFGQTESSPIIHETLCIKLNILTEEFLRARKALEAVGLLESYRKITETKTEYIYIVKNVLSPYQFLTNTFLSNLLNMVIGEEAYMQLIADYLVHNYNIYDFDNITSSYDEIFEINNSPIIENNNWLNDENQGIKIKSNHFDYDYFLVIVGALNIIKEEILRSIELYNEINQLAFMFNLTSDDLKDVIISAANNGEVDYDTLRYNARRTYEQNYLKTNIKQRDYQKSSNNDRLVEMLESLSPAQLVINKFGTALTGPEIEMFNNLLNNTGISIGVMNALILYVLNTKNGEIPNYNYFLKIINTWIRQGVKNTEDALNILNNPPKSKPRQTKQIKETASWYNEYQKQVDDSINKDKPTNQKNKQATIEELENFFKK